MKPRMFITVAAAAIIVVVAIYAAYSGAGTLPGSTLAGTHIVTDHLGRNVSVPNSPQRIVSLSGDLTEVLYAIGMGDKIVGVDRYSTYPPEALNKTVVGTTGSLNLETLVSLDPDLVLLWSYQASAIETMEKRNITVVAVDAASIDDLLNAMRFVGSICGKPAEVESLVSGIEDRISAIRMKTANLSDAEKPRVYLEGMTALKSYNSSTFSNDMIMIAGGINIAANESIKYPTIKSESIVMKDPQVIIVISSGATVESIKYRSGWQLIDAVVNDKVFSIDTKWCSANPRIIQGIEQMARWLHPELFQ